MRFKEIYGDATGPVISFEVFPPKTEQAEARLDAALPRLAALGPRFMTCTYGAGGSTRDKTLGITARIKNELGLEAACHLTCVGSSRSELREMVRRIVGAGLDNIVALRGDPPQGDLGRIYCGDGNPVYFPAPVRQMEPPFSTNEPKTSLDFPFASLRSPKSDSLGHS